MEGAAAAEVRAYRCTVENLGASGWVRTGVLASTDPDQHAEEVVRCDRLRSLVEIVIRDACWHTGRPHCEASQPGNLDPSPNTQSRWRVMAIAGWKVPGRS
jgi:hypothetical protein